MRRLVPVASGLAALAVVAGLVLGGGDQKEPVRRSGWTPLLVPRPDPGTRGPAQPTDGGPGNGPTILLPPATAPARVYPL